MLNHKAFMKHIIHVKEINLSFQASPSTHWLYYYVPPAMIYYLLLIFKVNVLYTDISRLKIRC